MKAQRVIVFAAVIAAVLLWGPFAVPNWAIVAFVVVLFPVALVVSGKQKRTENRLLRTLWKTLTRT